jgi:hypothetical protein
MKNHSMKQSFLWFTSALLPLTGLAQTLELPYESVFKEYQTYKEIKRLDWKASNEAVRAAGGWRAYQREAQAPDEAVNPAPALIKAEPIAQDKKHSQP